MSDKKNDTLELLAQSLIGIQRKKPELDKIESMQASIKDNQRAFIDILLTDYFGDPDKFKAFSVLKKDSIWANELGNEARYLEAKKGQALGFNSEVGTLNSYLIVLLPDVNGATLYHCNDNDVRRGNDELELFGRRKIDQYFVQVDSGFVTDAIHNSVKGDYRFSRFCLGLYHATKQASQEYGSWKKQTTQEEEKVSRALNVLQAGLKELKH